MNSPLVYLSGVWTFKRVVRLFMMLRKAQDVQSKIRSSTIADWLRLNSLFFLKSPDLFYTIPLQKPADIGKCQSGWSQNSWPTNINWIEFRLDGSFCDGKLHWNEFLRYNVTGDDTVVAHYSLVHGWKTVFKREVADGRGV